MDMLSKLQIGDLRFKKVNQKVEINDIDIDNNKANVEVLLDEKISFNDTPDIVSEEVTEHDNKLESVQEQILKETEEQVSNEKNELEKIKSENESKEEKRKCRTSSNTSSTV